MKAIIAKSGTINNNWPDYPALALWIFFSGVRIRLALELQEMYPLLLAFQSGLMAYLLVRRREPVRRVSMYQNLVAWSSALLPLLMRVQNVNLIGEVLAWAGLGLAVWAMTALDKSFGVAPADRGLVHTGPYRYIRHPMYAGEMLAVLGGMFGQWSVWNLFVLSILILTLFLRMAWEERVIEGYAGYAGAVRYRLIPRVW